MIAMVSELLARYSDLLRQKGVPSATHNDFKKWLRYYLDYCSKYKRIQTSSKSLQPYLAKLREKKQTEAQVKQAAYAVSLYLDMVKRPLEKPASPGAGPRITDAMYPSPSPGAAESKAAWDRAVIDLAGVIKTRHYSPKTLSSYTVWAQKFRGFTKGKLPSTLGTTDVKEYLTYLAVTCNVSASSQNQAFNALLFFFRHVLKSEFGDLKDVPRAKRSSYTSEQTT